MIRVEIVTPVHNRKAFTLRCLKSLSEINKSGLDIHVIVVDDGSTDGTGDEIRRNYPDVQIVNGDGNLWYAGGTNRGIEAALKRNPDYILAINDDSEFHPEFLQRMIKCSQQNTRSVVGALLLLRDDPDKVFAVAPKWQTWYGGWRQFRHLTVDTVPQKPWQVETIAGNCVLYPKQVIQEVGLMDERHFLLYADVEYLTRIRKAGWKLLIEPTSWAFCEPNTVSPSLRGLPFKTALRELLLNRYSRRGLRENFNTRWFSAPTKLIGLIAFLIYMTRFGLKAVGMRGQWPFWPDPDLSEN